jgi:CRISPR-associated protein Cas2
MFVVVFYDISDNRRRELIANKLLSMGLTRVQRSVFIGRGGLALAKDIARFAFRHVSGNDSVVVLVVPTDSLRNMLMVGREVSAGDHGVRVI